MHTEQLQKLHKGITNLFKFFADETTNLQRTESAIKTFFWRLQEMSSTTPIIIRQ